MYLVLIAALLFGVASAVAGQRKGMGGSGFALGALLGPIGLVIVLLSQGDRKPCPSCRDPGGVPSDRRWATGLSRPRMRRYETLMLRSNLMPVMARTGLVGSILLFRALALQGQTAHTAVSPGGWNVQRGRSPMNDMPSVTLTTRARSSIVGWLSEFVPELVVRCREGETDVYVITGMDANPEYGSSLATVRWRVDDKPPIEEGWGASTDGNGLFAGSYDSRRVIDSMLTGSRLRFEFTPFRANKAMADFGTAGLQSHIREVAAACNWAKEDSISAAQSVIAKRLPSFMYHRVPDTDTYFEFQVEKQARLLSRSRKPAFPDSLRAAGISKGSVVAEFVVDSEGRVDSSTFRVHETDGDAFASAVRETLPFMLFVPAEANGHHVRQLVEMNFDFDVKTSP